MFGTSDSDIEMPQVRISREAIALYELAESKWETYKKLPENKDKKLELSGGHQAMGRVSVSQDSSWRSFARNIGSEMAAACPLYNQDILVNANLGRGFSHKRNRYAKDIERRYVGTIHTAPRGVIALYDLALKQVISDNQGLFSADLASTSKDDLLVTQETRGGAIVQILQRFPSILDGTRTFGATERIFSSEKPIHCLAASPEDFRQAVVAGIGKVDVSGFDFSEVLKKKKKRNTRSMLNSCADVVSKLPKDVVLELSIDSVDMALYGAVDGLKKNNEEITTYCEKNSEVASYERDNKELGSLKQSDDFEKYFDLEKKISESAKNPKILGYLGLLEKKSSFLKKNKLNELKDSTADGVYEALLHGIIFNNTSLFSQLESSSPDQYDAKAKAVVAILEKFPNIMSFVPAPRDLFKSDPLKRVASSVAEFKLLVEHGMDLKYGEGKSGNLAFQSFDDSNNAALFTACSDAVCEALLHDIISKDQANFPVVEEAGAAVEIFEGQGDAKAKAVADILEQFPDIISFVSGQTDPFKSDPLNRVASSVSEFEDLAERGKKLKLNEILLFQTISQYSDTFPEVTEDDNGFVHEDNSLHSDERSPLIKAAVKEKNDESAAVSQMQESKALTVVYILEKHPDIMSCVQNQIDPFKADPLNRVAPSASEFKGLVEHGIDLRYGVGKSSALSFQAFNTSDNVALFKACSDAVVSCKQEKERAVSVVVDNSLALGNIGAQNTGFGQTPC